MRKSFFFLEETENFKTYVAADQKARNLAVSCLYYIRAEQ